jgi:SAM-dependent MidA family methyltransferase
MTELRRIVDAEIRRNGPMTLARFMELALYHPQHGYYSSGCPRTGWGGHFVTSPELDPAFGELWARAFERLWERCGSPETFDVIEIGPGEGSFALAVLGSAGPPFSDALTYRLVEPVHALRERQHARLKDHAAVRWSRSLEGLAPVVGCVFANEVLDNQPVHLVERRAGSTQELMVVERAGRLGLAPEPLSPPVRRWLARGGAEPAEGARIEVPLAADRLVDDAAHLVRRGALVLVDYGVDTDARTGKPTATLAAYSTAGADGLFLEDPGARDITSHVRWDAIRRRLRDSGLRPAGPISQRDALLSLGARDLVADLARSARRARGAEHVRALSRRQALDALLDPGGLGGLQAMAGTKGVQPPPWDLGA